MEKPVWFYDADIHDVVCLLRWFIVKLNKQEGQTRSKPLKKLLKQKDLPGLFEYSNSDKRDFIREVLDELSSPPYHIWSVVEREDDLALVFNFSAEALLREWLDMPLISNSDYAWRNILDSMSAQIDSSLLQKLHEIGYPGGYSPSKIVLAVKCLSDYLNDFFDNKFDAEHVFSWRQLSAHFFLGDSKYLESDFRRAWLLALFPNLGGILKERVIPVMVVLAAEVKSVLFIENWDSFSWLEGIPGVQSRYHLVYTAGFKVSAKDIRKKDAVSFFYTGEYSSRLAFEAFWFSRDEQLMSSYFWGDLDFSGLQILESLTNQFSGVAAWVPGYQPMVNALMSGIGHEPMDAGKNNQLQVGKLSCVYAASVLRKSLTDTGLMLDQEWLSERTLLDFLVLD